MTKTKNTNKILKSEKVTSTIAKSDDGTIQITFTIPYKRIKEAEEKALTELGENTEVPGFRKGKAPPEKLKQQIPENTLLERTLSKILPKLTTELINKHKIKPAVYPKFELISAKLNESWQIRAVTCEIPQFEIGDYKKIVKGSSNAKQIWTPDKGKAEGKAKPTREEKEQAVLKALLDSTKITIPQVLLDQEATSRLSRLLERIEKLGLTLDGYLASINKTAEVLRKEYKEQSRQSLVIDLILSKVAEKENIIVENNQIDAAIKASSADPELAKNLDTPEQRRVIESVLRRRATLDFLISLA